MSDTVLFSGVVVTCNDAHRLKECLNSLSFCDELIVVDLESTDGSDLVAKASGAVVYTHERVPLVEMIREVAFAYAQYPWIIHIDPDEVFPVERLPEVIQIPQSSDVAIIRLPWQFYFRNRPLRGTVWGGENSKPCVFHRERIVLSKDVHVCPKPSGAFREVQLLDSNTGAISHYWVDSYGQMFEKHLRYIQREGKAKYTAGERFAWRNLTRNAYFAFKDSFITHKGWLDNVTGMLLSLFYSWYVFMSYLSLRKYQNQIQCKNNKEQEQLS